MNLKTTFKELISPLQQEEFEKLEHSILSEGCRDSIVVWKDTIVDGHNRYSICMKHSIPFNTVERQFEDENEVKIWMLNNQLARRNINAYQRVKIALQLEDMFKDQGKTKQKQAGGALPQKSDKPPIDTKKEVAKIANVSHDTVAKVKVIEKDASNSVKQLLASDDISINEARFLAGRKHEEQEQALKILNAGEAKNARQAINTLIRQSKFTPPALKGVYRVIYADPPGRYGDKRDERTGSAELHYPTMSISELCSMPVKDMTEPDAVLFLWVTAPLLEESFEVVKAWGFKYKTCFVWDKVKHNMGHYHSVRHEILLVCTKGSCLPDNNKLFDSVVSIERSDKHSEKPEQFREIIDTLYTGNRIELFSRKKINGWENWGNELPAPGSSKGLFSKDMVTSIIEKYKNRPYELEGLEQL